MKAESADDERSFVGYHYYSSCLVLSFFFAMVCRLIFLVLIFWTGNAFQSLSERRAGSSLAMAPKYDRLTQRWYPTSPEEEPSAGYGIGKTLLLKGPKPFFHRLLTADAYEQAVLKFMAGDGCSRVEAQGNMDAYLENPNDWAYNRLEEQRTGFKQNYTEIDQKQLTLTLTWSVIILSVIGRSIWSISTGEPFWGDIRFDQ